MKTLKSTSWYVFDTTSRYKSQKSCDCVVRSISLATGKSWEEVYDDLCTIGRKLCRMPNEKLVYGRYLQSIGWEKMPAPRKQDNHRFLAKEFVVSHKETIIAHVGGHHLSCFIEGRIHDIWDCGSYSVGNFWVKRKD